MRRLDLANHFWKKKEVTHVTLTMIQIDMDPLEFDVETRFLHLVVELHHCMQYGLLYPKPC